MHIAKPRCSWYGLHPNTALVCGVSCNLCCAADDGAHLYTDSEQTSSDADSSSSDANSSSSSDANSSSSDADSSSSSSDADSSSSSDADSSSSDADSSSGIDANTGSSSSSNDADSSSDADSNIKANADRSNRAGAGDDESRKGGTAQATPQAAHAGLLSAEHDSAGPAHAAALVPPEEHSLAAAKHAIAGSAPINPALTPAVASADPAPAGPSPAAPAPASSASASEVQQLFPALSKKRTLDSMLVGCSSRYERICICTCVRISMQVLAHVSSHRQTIFGVHIMHEIMSAMRIKRTTKVHSS